MKKFKKSLRTVFLSTAFTILGSGLFAENAYADIYRTRGDVHSVSTDQDTYATSYLIANYNGTMYSYDQVSACGNYMYAYNQGRKLKYILCMQPDGNLVLYRKHIDAPPNVTGQAIWSSGTYGSGANRAVMQQDGNLVLYRADGRAVWASNTQYRNNGATHTILQLQQDGNLVMYNIYYPNGQAQYVPIWATGTNE